MITWTDPRPERTESYIPEVEKARDIFLPWVSGIGLDLGCGCQKICREAIGIDHEFIQGTTNIAWDLNTDLSIIAPESVDYIFSSHLLEHLVDPGARLLDWWSKIKPGGYLMLYLPHPEYIGHQDSTHLWKWLFPVVIYTWMRGLDYKIILEQDRPRDPEVAEVRQEYSFCLILEKKR